MPNFHFYTNYEKGNNVVLQKGIFSIAKSDVVPAIITSSSPHKAGSKETPWEDFYNVDQGHIRYFGDNKDSSNPTEVDGNKALLQQFEYHKSSDTETRKKSSPIIFFNRKEPGKLEFCGFGIISNAERVVQLDKDRKPFVNYRFDFVVLDLSKENEFFDWEWINARRDKNISLEKTEKLAPASWKNWLKFGNKNIEMLRRNVVKNNISNEKNQRPNSNEESTLKVIYKYYSEKKKRFENLASIVTNHYFMKETNSYRKGWITKGSGDQGIDFVGRLDIGSGFGSAKIVILGQAKCERLDSPTNAIHIARTVAKLKRGWIGVFVTTSYFSSKVQEEILYDKYPILLINGKILASIVNQIIFENKHDSVETYLKEIDKLYESELELKFRDPEEILND